MYNKFWQTRGQYLREPPPVCKGIWYGPADPYPNLVDKLNASAELVYLGISFPPLGIKNNSKSELMQLCIDAGLPIILWVREQIDSAELRAELEKLLPPENPLALPRKVWDMRRQAHLNRTPHVGKFLSLIWDHPERAVQENALGLTP